MAWRVSKQCERSRFTNRKVDIIGRGEERGGGRGGGGCAGPGEDRGGGGERGGKVG